MKTLFLIILAATGLGVAAFGAYYSWHKPNVVRAESVAFDELEWLRREFDLSEEQMARVEAAHVEYRPVCDSLCDQVIQARKQLEATLLASDSVTPELEAQLAHFSQVKEKCQRFMLEHVYQVADVMEPEQRQRYLSAAKAQITMHEPARR